MNVHHFRGILNRLKPGEAVNLCSREVAQCESGGYFDRLHGVEAILTGVLGSAFEIEYLEGPQVTTLWRRTEAPPEGGWLRVEPDRQALFEKRDGYFYPRAQVPPTAKPLT